MFTVKRGIGKDKGDHSKFIFARIMRLFGLTIVSENQLQPRVGTRMRFSCYEDAQHLTDYFLFLFIV